MSYRLVNTAENGDMQPLISHSEYLKLPHSQREKYVTMGDKNSSVIKPERFAVGMSIEVFYTVGNNTTSSYKVRITKSTPDHIWVDNHVYIDGKREQLVFSLKNGKCETYPATHPQYSSRPYIQVN